MIELTHIATGALAGRRCDSALLAFVVGVGTHALMDMTPHGEIRDRRWEELSTTAGLLVLASRYGVRSPLLWGAIGGVIPDGEHVLPKGLKPARPLFPTHRFKQLHNSEGRFAVPATLQVIFGGAVIGTLAMLARR